MRGRWIDRWNEYWFEPIPAFPIAAVRVLFGLYFVAYFGVGIPEVHLTLSSQGVPLPFLISPDAAPSIQLAALLYAITLAAAIAFTVGYGTAIAARILFVLFVYHFIMSGGVYSYDRLNIILLGIFCGADSGAVWSIDARRHGAKPTVSAWATRLIKLEIATMYFGSGLYKVLNPQWRDGTLLQMTFAGEWATPAAFWIVSHDLPGWIWNLLTWSVIGFELMISFALYGRRTRMTAIACGTGFHIANWIFLGLPQFANCVVMYPLFGDPTTVKRLGERPWKGSGQSVVRLWRE